MFFQFLGTLSWNPQLIRNLLREYLCGFQVPRSILKEPNEVHLRQAWYYLYFTFSLINQACPMNFLKTISFIPPWAPLSFYLIVVFWAQGYEGNIKSVRWARPLSLLLVGLSGSFYVTDFMVFISSSFGRLVLFLCYHEAVQITEEEIPDPNKRTEGSGSSFV